MWLDYCNIVIYNSNRNTKEVKTMGEKQKKVLEALGKVVAKLSDAKLAELAAYGGGHGVHGGSQGRESQLNAR